MKLHALEAVAAASDLKIHPAAIDDKAVFAGLASFFEGPQLVRDNGGAQTERTCPPRSDWRSR